MKFFHFRFLIFACICFFPFFSCAGNAISAEEYFAIGMAYFDMGKYTEAEQWLIKAKSADKTMNASSYNLGRIAFEAKRYESAAKHFDAVLEKDPQNVTALKAAAYTCIKTGEFDKAEIYYEKMLALVPESADSGYNYALVLYALGKYEESERVLLNYQAALMDNKEIRLLYARTQKEQRKPEAVDSYAQWLSSFGKDDLKVRYEYAACLEYTGVFVQAIAEYRAVYEGLSADSKSPSKSTARFALARALLIGDSENAEGIAELEGAVRDGFADFDAIKLLLDQESVSVSRKADIQRIIDNPPKPAQKEEEKTEKIEKGEGAEKEKKEPEPLDIDKPK